MLPFVSNAQTANKDHLKSTQTLTWERAKNNSWPGVLNEQPYRNKLDEKGKLWWSSDGKNWVEDTDGMWADKEGVFYKMDGSKVVESKDGASTWDETSEWKWLAVDGRWYKLDKDGVVWVSK